MKTFQLCISMYVNFTSIKILFYKVIALRSNMRGREDKPSAVLFIASPSGLLEICKSMCMNYLKFFKFWKMKHMKCEAPYCHDFMEDRRWDKISCLERYHLPAKPKHWTTRSRDRVFSDQCRDFVYYCFKKDEIVINMVIF